jgi:hypothetical protein
MQHKHEYKFLHSYSFPFPPCQQHSWQATVLKFFQWCISLFGRWCTQVVEGTCTCVNMHHANSCCMQDHSVDCPVLACSTWDILAIPGVSISVEQLFLSSKHTLSDLQSSMTAESTSKMAIVKKWLKKSFSQVLVMAWIILMVFVLKNNLIILWLHWIYQNTLWYEYPSNTYDNLNTEYNMITIYYDQNHNIIVFGQPYLPPYPN